MRIRLVFVAFFVFASAMYAQNARNILDKAADTYNKAGGVKVSFVLEAKDPGAKVTHSSDGSASLKGNKFHIETPDIVTWFDGKTQWVYMKDTEEVNITNPSDSELQGISPVYLFNIYKKGFVLTYKGEIRDGGKAKYHIEMTPEKKTEDIKGITVYIDKDTNMFSYVKMTDKSGMENSLRIVKFDKGLSISDNTFVFNKSDYPDAEIVDLR